MGCCGGSGAASSPLLSLALLTTLMWAGNGVAGRLAVGEISPMALTCLRWVVVVVILGNLMRRQVAAEWPELAPRWPSHCRDGRPRLHGLQRAFLYRRPPHHRGQHHDLPGCDPGIRAGRQCPVPRSRACSWLQVVGHDASRSSGVAVVATKGDSHVLQHDGAQYRRRLHAHRCAFYAGYTLAPAQPARRYPGSSSSRRSRAWPF